jgi:hypothetical protein
LHVPSLWSSPETNQVEKIQLWCSLRTQHRSMGPQVWLCHAEAGFTRRPHSLHLQPDGTESGATMRPKTEASWSNHLKNTK